MNCTKSTIESIAANSGIIPWITLIASRITILIDRKLFQSNVQAKDTNQLTINCSVAAILVGKIASQLPGKQINPNLFEIVASEFIRHEIQEIEIDIYAVIGHAFQETHPDLAMELVLQSIDTRQVVLDFLKS